MQCVFDVHDAVSEIYFPTNAVVSLVVPLSTGEIVETAMVGRDGVIAARPRSMGGFRSTAVSCKSAEIVCFAPSMR